MSNSGSNNSGNNNSNNGSRPASATGHHPQTHSHSHGGNDRAGAGGGAGGGGTGGGGGYRGGHRRGGSNGDRGGYRNYNNASNSFRGASGGGPAGSQSDAHMNREGRGDSSSARGKWNGSTGKHFNHGMNGHGHFNEQLDRIYFLLMHMVGTKVSVTTKDNAQFEGILHAATANSDFGVVLNMARRIVEGKPAGDVIDSLVIFPKDLIALSCVELEVANEPSNSGGAIKAGGFQTDSSIGSRAGEFGRERELVQWSTDEVDTTQALENPGGLAGEKWDQFATNEKLFGVQTDFQEEMYTTVIDKSDPHYRKKEAEAIRLAKEMESEFGKTDNSHLLEERNMIIPDDDSNEEEKYSAVVRKTDGSSWRVRPASFAVPDSAGSNREALQGGDLLKQKPELVPISTKPDPGFNEGSLSTAPASTKPSALPSSPLVKRSKSPGHTGHQKSTAAPPVTTTVNAMTNKPLISASKSFAVKTGSERKEELLNKLPVKVAVDAVQTRDPVGDTFQKFHMFAERERKQVKRPLRDAMAKPKPEIISELKAFSTSFKLPMPFPSDLKEIIKKSPDEGSAPNADSPKEAASASPVRGSSGKSSNKPSSYSNERSASEVIPPSSTSPVAAMQPASASSSYSSSIPPQNGDKEKSKFKFNLSAVEFTPLGGASPGSQSQSVSRSGSGISAPKGPMRNNSGGYNKGYQKNGNNFQQQFRPPYPGQPQYEENNNFPPPMMDPSQNYFYQIPGAPYNFRPIMTAGRPGFIPQMAQAIMGPNGVQYMVPYPIPPGAIVPQMMGPVPPNMVYGRPPNPQQPPQSGPGNGSAKNGGPPPPTTDPSAQPQTTRVPSPTSTSAPSLPQQQQPLSPHPHQQHPGGQMVPAGYAAASPAQQNRGMPYAQPPPPGPLGAQPILPEMYQAMIGYVPQLHQMAPMPGYYPGHPMSGMVAPMGWTMDPMQLAEMQQHMIAGPHQGMVMHMHPHQQPQEHPASAAAQQGSQIDDGSGGDPEGEGEEQEDEGHGGDANEAEWVASRGGDDDDGEWEDGRENA
ncbi:hypothetical protein HDU83_002319 [Entophlyctis luteolus]|nr:hypothetical protein HDU83_002319 [Entophlyctis luteolus]